MPAGVYDHSNHPTIFKKGNRTWNTGMKGLQPWMNLSGIRSKESREKMRKTKTGTKLSMETRKKMSEAHKKRVAEGKNNFWKGGIWTYERKLFQNRHRGYLKKNANGSHTQEEWENLKKAYNFTCLKCYKKEPEIKLTEDHIIPLSKSGSNFIENIQPLCGRCNASKFNHDTDFRRITRDGR